MRNAENPAFDASAPGPPYMMLVAGLWIVVVAAVLGAGLSPLSTNSLAGSDDYMRFVRIFAWLDGAEWYEQTITRLNAPYGAEVPWSRAIDLPHALIMSILTPFLGRLDAAMLSATIVPPMILLGLLFASGAMVRPLVGRRHMIIGPVIVVLLPNLVSSSLPGRIDHHGWQILLMCAALAALARMAAQQPIRSAILTGFTFSLSLWVGGETVPWLAVANAALAILWILDGRPIVRVSLTFAGALALSTTILFPIARDPALWSITACDTFSLPTLGLVAAVLTFWTAVSLAANRLQSVFGRATTATILALAIGGSWINFFPQCATGPYGELDPAIAENWLRTIGEAQNFITYASAVPGSALAIIFAPAIAVVTGFSCLRKYRHDRQRRALWTIYSVFCVGALGLALWQIRVTPFANLYAVPALTWLVTSAWQKIDSQMAQQFRRVAKAFALVSIGILNAAFGTLDQIANSSSPISPFPDGQIREWTVEACDLGAAVSAIADRQTTPTVIAAPLDIGAELLFRSQHAVIGAPYHRNTDGIIDSQTIFNSTDESAISQIFSKRGVRYLILCPSMPEMLLYQAGPGLDSLAEKLVSGEIPSWLSRIPVPIASGTLVYQVVTQ